MNKRDAGRIGGLVTHSRYDSYAHLAPARRGYWAKFEREVDPDGILSPAERKVRAERAMRAHMMRMAAKSAEARRKKAS